MDEEQVFKALADYHRRVLLDSLFQEDGQSLSELCTELPMTRYGVMKHLGVLEAAGLITTRKVGREKLHYLNPVPIQLVYDRWVSKYSQRWAQSLTQLKFILEETPMHNQSQVYTVFIKSTPERVWQALTDGALTPQYYMGTRVESTWETGAPYRYVSPNGMVMLEGTVVEADPPRKLVTTFQPRWDQAFAIEESLVTVEITREGDLVRLTLVHDKLDLASDMAKGFNEGWSRILSGLKTLLETGEPLPMMPAM